MDFEHAFQHAGFLAAFQILVVGSLIAPGILGGSALHHRFVRAIASQVVSFGPFGILAFVLYKVSHLS